MYFPPMFRNIFNFGYQRRGMEVVAFYITYLIGILMADAVVGSVVASIAGSDAARITYHVDSITASIIVLVITFLIIKQKHLGPNIIYMLLPLATAILCQIATPIIALIIPTFLSTRPSEFKFTPPPKRGDDGASEESLKIKKEDLPPQTPLGDTKR